MQEHGSFTIEIIDQTLIIKCFDAWNLETVIRLCREYKEHVESIKDKPWACLVDLSKWELSTPEMWDEISKLNEWGNLNNQKYEVVIFGMYIQQTLMEESHTVLTNVETKFYDTIEQAYEWLISIRMLNNIKKIQ